MKEIKNLSKIRLFVGIVITAVAMFIFMPINVFATTDYEIYVNGEQFTSEKTTINCGDGTATFDISTNTLILNNATITKRYGSQYAVINSKISNLTIQLIGNNVIDGNKGEYDGIGADGGSNVVIVGDGNLTMKDVYYGTYIGDYSVPGGNLKINNTTINIENAQATGIWVNHDLEIINSNIKIDKTGDDLYSGIVSNIGGTITIDGGNLDINTNSHCILLGNGDDSNHNVVIKSGNIKLNSRRNGTYGIKFEPVLNTDTINGNIKIDGGNLEISAIAGGTNIDDSKITINSKLIFLKGTSLKDNGKILLNEAKNYYTVTFDSNGGSAVTAQSIEAGQKATKPADPTKDGYDFKGWTLNGSAYDFNTAVNGNITLVATWEQQQVVPTTYTVSFAANGGTGTMADVTGISGEYTLPENGFTAPDGKQFKAWSVGGVEKAVGDTINVTANTTVIAQWTTILDKPTNLVWDGTTAKWDAVTGANNYKVILRASEREISGDYAYISNTDITNKSMDYAVYMLPGMYYYFEVAAYNSANYSGTFSGFDSSAKKQMPGSIGTVTGFAWSGNTISWNAVTDATGYDVWVMKDGVQKGSVRNVSGTSLDLTSDFESGGEGTYYVSVSAYKLARGNYLAKGNSPAKIIGATPIYSAAVRNVSVNGTIGTAITETQVVIDLTNDTFVSALSGNWITNLPAGLSQSVSYGGTTMAIITISGTPTAASTEQIAITIPADQLIVNTEDLTVTANADAKFNISAPTYTVTINAGANMTLASGNANQSGLSGAMTDTVYTAADGYYFPTDYTVAAVNGITVTRIDFTKIKVSGTPTAAANITLTAPTAKTKEATPTAVFTANGTDSGKLTGIAAGMKYRIGGGAWVDITATEANLTGLSACTITIMKSGNGTTTLDSDEQTITVTKAAKPALKPTLLTLAGGKGSIPTTAAHEFSTDGAAWTPCTGATENLDTGKYYVRVKANGTQLASETQEIDIFLYGDVNGDGKVDIDDLTRLRRYIAESSTVIFPGADANGDGTVDIDDLTRLRRYVAEEAVVLGK